MGDSTDLILNGILCQICGTFISEEPKGYPINCEDCEEEENE